MILFFWKLCREKWDGFKLSGDIICERNLVNCMDVKFDFDKMVKRGVICNWIER